MCPKTFGRRYEGGGVGMATRTGLRPGRHEARAALLLTVALLLAVPVTAAPAGSVPSAPAKPPAQPEKPSTDKAVFFASDGMRPDLVERYVAEGAMPTFDDLLRNGVAGDNGLLQGFPPNTGVRSEERRVGKECRCRWSA